MIHGGGTYHIESSPFIFRANQWTGFFMIETSIMKVLNQHFFLSIRETRRQWQIFEIDFDHIR